MLNPICFAICSKSMLVPKSATEFRKKFMFMLFYSFYATLRDMDDLFISFLFYSLVLFYYSFSLCLSYSLSFVYYCLINYLC